MAAMLTWFTGLFFLPRLFIAHLRRQSDGAESQFYPLANDVYFRLMTPAGVLTIALGAILVSYGRAGAWLAMKLVLVAAAVVVHIYQGMLLRKLIEEGRHHGTVPLWILGWAPLLLLLGIAALSGAKPMAFHPFPFPSWLHEAVQ